MAKKKNSQSRVISARLHPSDEREKDALEIIDKLMEKGFSMRQIVTDAILRADGRTPEMYRDIDENITKGHLESTLEDFADYILEKLQLDGITLTPSDKKADETKPFDSDEDIDVMKNMADGYLARRKRGNQ